MTPSFDLRKLARERAALDELYVSARAAKLQAVTEWRDAGGHISRLDWQVVDPGRRWGEVEQTRSFYAFASRLAFPPSLFDDMDWMRTTPVGTSARRVASVLEWLAEDPFCLNSGFYKQKVLRLLRRFQLTAEQAEQLRVIILTTITRGPRAEFRELCRLARQVDSAQFRTALRELAENSDEGTRWRALQVLGACERPTARTLPSAMHE